MEKKITHTLTANQLVELKNIYKYFSLKRVDEYVFENPPPYYSFGLRKIAILTECIIGQ